MHASHRQAMESGPKLARLGFVAGLIQQQKMPGFERLLFRATRGNMFLRSTQVGKVRDPSTGEQQDKSVFVVFFAGERAKTKIMKVGMPQMKVFHIPVVNMLKNIIYW